jgi:hypothetical protein
MLSPCARLVRIMSPTVPPRRCAWRPRRTLCSRDYQRALAGFSAQPRPLVKILPRTSVTVDRFCPSLVRSNVSVLVVNGSLDLTARAIVLQAFLFHLAVQGAATEFRCAGQMHRTRDARAVGCNSLVSRVAIHRVKRDSRTCWRAASSEAFALYVIVAECGRAPKIFPKRAHKRACSRLVRIM